MTTKVCILATCLNGNLNPTLLVFGSIRVGFPTAEIMVFGNGLKPVEVPVVKAVCEHNRCTFVSLPRVSHDRWIELMLEQSPCAFWICDTDVVFHSSVEGFVNEDTVLKGRYEAPFVEPWSKTTKAERLHTSLLYLNAPALRLKMCAWVRKWHPAKFPFAPTTEFVRQHFVPVGFANPPVFYDTCAGLYLALGGERFTDEENGAFDHLHCGTYVDRMLNVIPGLAEAHAAIYAQPETSKLLKENQKEFYARQAPA